MEHLLFMLVFVMLSCLFMAALWSPASADQEGGTGGPDPPGKSQVIWVSIGNKQLDPPGKSWTPPGT